MSQTISLGADVYGNITCMDNVVDGLVKELDAYQTMLQDTQTQLANAKAEMETPFAREKELGEKSARLKELNILLNMDQKDHALLDDAPDQDSADKNRVKEYEQLRIFKLLSSNVPFFQFMLHHNQQCVYL